jgi:hypothetical protein
MALFRICHWPSSRVQLETNAGRVLNAAEQLPREGGRGREPMTRSSGSSRSSPSLADAILLKDLNSVPELAFADQNTRVKA